MLIPKLVNVAHTDIANTFTEDQTIQSDRLTIIVPGGGAPQVFLDHDRASGSPSIRWRSESGMTGIRFYSVSPTDVVTEVARLQDNGFALFAQIGTLGGVNIGDFYIRRGTAHEYALGGGGDAFRLDARILTSHELSAFARSSTTDSRAMWQFNSTWVESTDATRKARTVWTEYDTAAREIMRGEASGIAPMIGFLGAAAVLRPVITGSTDSDKINSVIAALAALGLATDSTT